MAWLHKRTLGRPVILLTGDARRKRFGKAFGSDRKTALEFLRRNDVTVKTWFSKKPPGREAITHAKAWIVKKPRGAAALVGSANLTEQGLRHNFEMMANAADREVLALVGEMERALAMAKDSKERIAGYLEESQWSDLRTEQDWKYSEESDRRHLDDLF